MKRKLKCIGSIFVSLTFLFSITVFAQDNDPHKTGLKELTPEELIMIENSHPKVIKVKLNKMGLDRVNEHRQKKKMSLLSTEAAVPEGEDIQTAVGPVPVPMEESSAVGVLPDSVDNSTLKYFPPIRSQGSLGSCGTFSGVYYAMTYMMAKARDLDAKNGGDNYRLSPKWGYNMVNGGANVGSWYYWNYNIGIKHGFATWSEFPYDGADYLTWDTNPVHWKNAIYRRFDKFGYVANTNTDIGINQVKQMLVDGYILNIPTYVYSWQYKAIGNDPDTTMDDSFVGKQICYWVNGTSGYHAMTVVGYNDNIWVDINSNNVVDVGEKGAFRIANSWGTGWGEAGFVWMAYDALKNPSAVVGGPSTARQLGWSPANAHYVTARASYTPTLLAQFTLNHLKRNQLAITVGVSDTASNAPTTIWSPSYMLSSAGGAYSFDGKTTAVDGSFVFDLTDIVPATSGINRFYLGMRDTTLGDVATVKSFKLINVATGTEIYSSAVPQTADASQVYVAVDNNFNTGNLPPVAVISASMISGNAPLSVAFYGDSSSDSDGAIVSYAWDFGDGVTTTGSQVSHVYQGPGTFKAMLTVTDNYGATASTSVDISVSPDPNIVIAPSNLTAKALSYNVTLNWFDNSNNEDGFYLERAVKAKGTMKFQRVAQIGANLSTYKETVSSSGSYVYRIQAFNTMGRISGYSNSVNINVRGK